MNSAKVYLFIFSCNTSKLAAYKKFFAETVEKFYVLVSRDTRFFIYRLARKRVHILGAVKAISWCISKKTSPHEEERRAQDVFVRYSKKEPLNDLDVLGEDTGHGGAEDGKADEDVGLTGKAGDFTLEALQGTTDDANAIASTKLGGNEVNR